MKVQYIPDHSKIMYRSYYSYNKYYKPNAWLKNKKVLLSQLELTYLKMDLQRSKFNIPLRGSSQNFGIFFIIGPILLKFSHNM